MSRKPGPAQPLPCDFCKALPAPFGYAPPPALMKPRRPIWACATPACRQMAEDRRAAAIARFDPFASPRTLRGADPLPSGQKSLFE